MKRLLSLLKLHILKITLRENSRPRSPIRSECWKKRGIIDRVQGKTPWWIEKYFIRTHLKWIDYYRLWTSIFWRPRWDKSPGQDSHLIKVLITRRRIGRVQGRTPWWIEKSFIRTHSTWIAYYHIWISKFLISLWEQIPIQYFSIWSKLWKTRIRIYIFKGNTPWNV